MINVPEEMWDTWASGQFVGDNRPVTRVTVSKQRVQVVPGSRARTILFHDMDSGENQVFGDGDGETPIPVPAVADSYEVPNIQLVEIDRRLGSEAASLRITMRNNNPPDGLDNLDLAHDGSAGTPTRRTLKDLGKPGYYTFRRGVAIDTDGINPWTHESSEWVDLLIPNRVLKTFQGYGSDSAGNPANDTRLHLTGIWLIDRVEYKSDGQIVIEARDLAKLLIEQKIYPPLIPLVHYPLELCADRFVTDTRTERRAVQVPGQHGPNIAERITSGPDSSTYYAVGNNGTILGARVESAFDGSDATWWLSRGYSNANGYEWISANTGGEIINRIRIHQRFGGYKLYISVKVEGEWIGSNRIPAPDSHASIRYLVETETPAGWGWFTVSFSDYSADIATFYNADEVRLTFTNLYETDLAERGVSNLPYRASIYEFEVDQYTPYLEYDEDVEVEFQRLVEGNISDYTSIVKILAAYSGFFWPNTNADPDLTDFDPALQGRVWGDFFDSGAYPVDPACIPSSYWDQKSVMDCINQVKEILGFIFQVDTTGGIQWRPPNIWRTGNYVLGQGYQGDTSVRTVSEENVLIDYGTTIDDQNLRSDIVVVSADDPSVYGSFRPGWAEGESTPGTQLTDLSLLGGQERTMLVANYPFGTADDPNARAAIEKFAFLVSLWIHWSYRKSRFRIPGVPAFEVDDQVRIYERVTSETYVHYIEGYTSTMDMEAGTWFMDVDTHWLGNGPDQQWVIRSQDMHPALFAYLESIGQLPSEVTDNPASYPDDWYEYTPPVPPDTDIRVPDDYSHLFPLPPGLEWPSGNISSEVGGPGGVNGGTGGWTSPPSPGTGGGNAINCSNAAMFSHWGPNCGGAPQKRVLFAAPAGSGSPKAHANQTSYIYLNVHAHAAPAFEALSQIIVSEQYQLKSGQCGSYNCRRVKLSTGGYSTSWSNHSWATAVDLNSADLPHGRSAPGGHPVYRVAQRALGLRTGNGKPIFRWGGNWSGTQQDPMHFEVCCTPADLGTGVTGSGGVSNPGGGGGGGGATPF